MSDTMVCVIGRNKNPKNEAAAQTEATAAVPADEAVEPQSVDGKKNRPTPKRSAQEAARKQPLVQRDRKEANKRAKEDMRKQRETARMGMMNGDERYLTARDRGPQRRYVRDLVDARFSIGELLIPVAVIVLLIGFVSNTQVKAISTIVVYGLFALIILDSVFLTWQMKSRMNAKFGKGSLERGLNFYAIMRAIQLRPLRMPKPQVKRGQYPS